MKDNKFVQIKNTEVLDLNISDNAFRIYAYLKTHDLDKFSPNYNLIGKDLNKSRMTIYRGLKELELKNLIIVMLDSNQGYLKINFIKKRTSILV